MKDHPIQQKQSAAASPDHAEAAVEGLAMAPPAFQLFATEANEAPPAKPPGDDTGLPAELVEGFLATTGHDLSDVQVHKNSDRPQKMGALAFAQGNDIHLGPGQEQHLAHEAAHIVQQREGRVAATAEIAGLPVNDQLDLENEADAMARQVQNNKLTTLPTAKTAVASQQDAVQLRVAPLQFDREQVYPRIEMMAPETYAGGSPEVARFAVLLQRSLLPNLPAHFTRGPHILGLWPAVANILHAEIDGSNTYAITDATSAFNPSSYTQLEENERNVLQAFYNARWNCRTAAERQRLIRQGRAAATRNLASSLIQYYFQEESRSAIADLFGQFIDGRLRAMLSERFFTLSADGQLQAYVPPPRPPRPAAVPTDPREIEMGTLADRVAEARLADTTISSTSAVATTAPDTTAVGGESITPDATAAETTRLPGYHRINTANMAAESGGSYTPSRIGTSAGRPASLGRSQLLVELQVERCTHYLEGRDGSGRRIAATEAAHYQRVVQILTDAQLTAAKLADIDRRGKLMAALYSLVTVGDASRGGDDSGHARELTAAMRRVEAAGMDASGIRASGLARDATALARTTPGSRSVDDALDLEREGAPETAIGSSDLVAMSDYNAIRRGHLEFRALMAEYARLHPRITDAVATRRVIDEDTNPRFADVRAMLRQETGLTIAGMSSDGNEPIVRRFFRSLPTISPLVTRMMAAHAGEFNQMAESDIDRHMSRTLTAEDRNSWYTRGAMNSPFWREFEVIMPALDRFTTEERHLDNFQRALAAASTMAGWAALGREAQEVMIGQMARVNHGSPGNFQEWYGGDERSITSVDAYRSHVAGLFHENGSADHARSRGIFSWTRHYCEQQHLDPTDSSVELFLPTAVRTRMANLISNDANRRARRR